MAYKNKADALANQRRRRAANPERFREYDRRYRKANRERLLAQQREWLENNRERKAATDAANNARVRKNRREKIFALLGGAVCVGCGFTDQRALQIDHIDGGGHQHRKRAKSIGAYYDEI